MSVVASPGSGVVGGGGPGPQVGGGKSAFHHNHNLIAKQLTHQVPLIITINYNNCFISLFS